MGGTEIPVAVGAEETGAAGGTVVIGAFAVVDGAGAIAFLGGQPLPSAWGFLSTGFIRGTAFTRTAGTIPTGDIIPMGDVTDLATTRTAASIITTAQFIRDAPSAVPIRG